MKVEFYFEKIKIGERGRPQEWLFATYGGLLYRTSISRTKWHKLSVTTQNDFVKFIMQQLNAEGKEFTFS